MSCVKCLLGGRIQTLWSILGNNSWKEVEQQFGLATKVGNQDQSGQNQECVELTAKMEAKLGGPQGKEFHQRPSRQTKTMKIKRIKRQKKLNAESRPQSDHGTEQNSKTIPASSTSNAVRSKEGFNDWDVGKSIYNICELHDVAVLL